MGVEGVNAVSSMDASGRQLRSGRKYYTSRQAKTQKVAKEKMVSQVKLEQGKSRAKMFVACAGATAVVGVACAAMAFYANELDGLVNQYNPFAAEPAGWLW